MKEVKISHLLKSNLEDFLAKVGATRNKTGYPSQVFVSERDAAIMKRNTRKKFRKANKYGSKKLIDVTTGMYWFQYGPNTTLKKAIRPGYALVDVNEIDLLDAKANEPYVYKVTAVYKQTLWQQVKAFFDKHFVFRG